MLTIECDCGTVVGRVEPLGPDAILYAEYLDYRGPDRGLIPNRADRERGPGPVGQDERDRWEEFGDLTVPPPIDSSRGRGLYLVHRMSREMERARSPRGGSTVKVRFQGTPSP